MKLFVKTLTGEIIPVDIKEEEIIFFIKMELYLFHHQRKPVYMKLLDDEGELDDTKIAGDVLHEGDMIYLFIDNEQGERKIYIKKKKYASYR